MNSGGDMIISPKRVELA